MGFILCLDVFCGGAIDGSIKVWDARINLNPNVLEFDRKIPNSHGKYSFDVIYFLFDDYLKCILILSLLYTDTHYTYIIFKLLSLLLKIVKFVLLYC